MLTADVVVIAQGTPFLRVYLWCWSRTQACLPRTFPAVDEPGMQDGAQGKTAVDSALSCFKLLDGCAHVVGLATVVCNSEISAMDKLAGFKFP